MSPAALVPIALEMTVDEARRILEHPVFGDARCIEAHELLLLAAELHEARGDCCGDDDRPRRLNRMTAREIRALLPLWVEVDA